MLTGNDQSCNVTGLGSVKFKLWDGSQRVLENVRLVPKLRRNLISLGMLDANGNNFRSKNGVLRVMNGSMVMLKGVLNQGLYILQGEAIFGDAAISLSNQDETVLWHKRLGHISMGGLFNNYADKAYWTQRKSPLWASVKYVFWERLTG